MYKWPPWKPLCGQPHACNRTHLQPDATQTIENKFILLEKCSANNGVDDEYDYHDDKCIFLLQGTPERLMTHLVEEHSSVDPTYVEDFLLTYRTFLKTPDQVAQKLLTWFDDAKIRDRVSIITCWLLLWLFFFTVFRVESVITKDISLMFLWVDRQKLCVHHCACRRTQQKSQRNLAWFRRGSNPRCLTWCTFMHEQKIFLQCPMYKCTSM